MNGGPSSLENGVSQSRSTRPPAQTPGGHQAWGPRAGSPPDGHAGACTSQPRGSPRAHAGVSRSGRRSEGRVRRRHERRGLETRARGSKALVTLPVWGCARTGSAGGHRKLTSPLGGSRGRVRAVFPWVGVGAGREGLEAVAGNDSPRPPASWRPRGQREGRAARGGHRSGRTPASGPRGARWAKAHEGDLLPRWLWLPEPARWRARQPSSSFRSCHLFDPYT